MPSTAARPLRVPFSVLAQAVPVFALLASACGSGSGTEDAACAKTDGPAAGAWTMVAEFTEEGIHEGMDIGDLDGDGDLDVVANGYTSTNPGGDLTGAWAVASIDDRWHNQTVHVEYGLPYPKAQSYPMAL